jgi:hypothetical protein
MAYDALPKDAGNIPISTAYKPDTGFVAVQASSLTNTDGSGNVSGPINLNLTQVNSVAAVMASADGATAANVLLLANGLFNGTTEDRWRSNLDNISLVSAAGATTTQTSADQTNYNGRGVKVVLDMTNVGTGSVALTVQGKDPISGKYFTLLTGANVTTNSTNVYTVYPGVTSVANVSASDIVPRTWRVNVVANNANATTYTVAASVVV